MKYFHELENSTPSRLILATTASSYGVIVTPVNIPRIHQALCHRPNKTFVEKVCSELRKGARIGYYRPYGLPTTPGGYCKSKGRGC